MNFFHKYKTHFYVILFLLFSAFLAYMLIRLFFGPIISQPEQPAPDYSGGLPVSIDGQGNIVYPKDPSELPLIEPNRLPESAISDIARGGVTKTNTLESAPILGAAKSVIGNSIQYYNQSDGKFYKIDGNGQKINMSDKVFRDVENVVWSKKNDKAIIEFPDGANILYDFETEKQITLPKHWKDFDFAPTEDKIVAKSIGLDPSNRWLTMANADGSNAKYLEPLGEQDASVHSSWSPNNLTVAMYTEGIDLDRQNVYFVGQNNENFKSTVIEGRGFQPQWSPDGKTLLYSVYHTDNDMKPSLWLVNAQGESIGTGRRSLGLETWADKCSFAGGTELYCAVPQSLEKASGLFPELAATTNDLIYRVDLVSGVKRLVAIPDVATTVKNIHVSADQKTLFYTDGRTNELKKINL